MKYNKKLKILLVEDNDINRRFFVNSLKLMGLTCDIAINGIEAVKAYEEKEYNIIFMDCQMPVMDGYDAAKKIRTLDNRHIPIIAMTAHSMKGDKDKCLEAGMDDYLGKPFDFDEVINMLKKHVKTFEDHILNRNTNDCNDGSEINTDKNAEFNETLKLLMKESGFDEDFCRELLEDFCKQAKESLAVIKESITNNDLELSLIILHKLKGSAGTARANYMVHVLLEAEKAAKNGNNDLLIELMKKVEKLLDKLCEGRNEE